MRKPAGLGGRFVRHLVVGAGQVGSAVYAVLAQAHKVDIRDVEPYDGTADVLHVCIPWSDEFVDAVRGYRALHDADLVVVHSTVPVGTCDPEGWVHSPVRGRHPDLYQGVRTFTKHVGGARAAEAAACFQAAAVPTLVHDRAADTEAGKLWELVQFGVQVQVEKQIHAWCAEHGLDFDVVYTQFARSYNEGYEQLGEHRFVRPVLDHMPGPIGGHCVARNATLLDHWLARMAAG